MQAHAAERREHEVVLAPKRIRRPPPAEAAGLRYVTDSMPGITRRRAGKGFTYRDPHGRVITERKELARLRRLAIPPAWTAVWICPHPRGHLQATGRDARGRKQYRYHDEWRQIRDAHKFDRSWCRAGIAADPGAWMPTCVAQASARAGAGDRCVCSRPLIRVGNAEYARDNKSFGLTTIRHHHVEVNGSTIEFEFRGKGGKMHKVSTRSPSRPHRARLPRAAGPGASSTSTRRANAATSTGGRQRLPPGDQRRAVHRQGFPHLGRDRAGLLALSEFESFDTQAGKRNVTRHRAGRHNLGNTIAVCRKSYIHPAILDSTSTAACWSLKGRSRRRCARSWKA